MPALACRVDSTKYEVTRTDATKDAYRRRYQLLARAAGVQPDDIVAMLGWFVVQDHRWSRSTVSQYRASLVQAIEDADWLSDAEAEILVQSIARRPACLPKGAAKRTSGKKLKSLKPSSFERLVDHLRRTGGDEDALIAKILCHNVRLFLRPSEWLTAQVAGERLIVRNAKATNRRANGAQRERDLTGYGPTNVAELRGVLADLAKLFAAEPGRSRSEKIRLLFGRLSARLARACSKASVKRVSLYTTRHLGMASAKRCMSALEVAAAAGHGSVITAISHYAKAKAGWGAEIVNIPRPTPASLEKVRRSPKLDRTTNIRSIAARRLLKELAFVEAEFEELNRTGRDAWRATFRDAAKRNKLEGHSEADSVVGMKAANPEPPEPDEPDDLPEPPAGPRF